MKNTDIPTDIRILVRSLAKADEALALNQRIRKDLREDLMDWVRQHGESTENCVTVDFDEPIEGIRALRVEKRRSISLDVGRAEDILRSMGLWESCVEMVPVLDEDKLMALVYEGHVTEQQFGEMYPSTTTEAFVPVRPRRGKH